MYPNPISDMDTQNIKLLLPLSSQQSLKVVGFDDPLIARVPYDLYEARARDSVIRMDGSATRTPAVYAAGELWV